MLNQLSIDNVTDDSFLAIIIIRHRLPLSLSLLLASHQIGSHPFTLTWNELFLLNVTIFSTLPNRWNIWCKMSNETGYSSDSTITRKTVFWPPVVTVWWTLCDIGSVPDIGSGEPDAGDVTWKSWLCNATDAFYGFVFFVNMSIQWKHKTNNSNEKW